MPRTADAAAGNTAVDVAIAAAENAAPVAGCSMVVATAAAGQIAAATTGNDVVADDLCRPLYHDLHGDHCFCDLQRHGLLNLRHCCDPDHPRLALSDWFNA